MAEIPTIVNISIKKLIEELNKHNIPISDAFLFGSYANGTYTELSDIDLALVSEAFSGNRFMDKEKIRKYVVIVNTDISPMPFKPEDFNSENMFAREILRTGIKISVIK